MQNIGTLFLSFRHYRTCLFIDDAVGNNGVFRGPSWALCVVFPNQCADRGRGFRNGSPEPEAECPTAMSNKAMPVPSKLSEIDFGCSDELVMRETQFCPPPEPRK